MSTVFIFSILVASIVPPSDVRADRVDAIELNHLFDEAGKHVLSQYLFLDWIPSAGQFHVIAWRLAKRPGQRPVRDAAGGWVVVWFDGGRLRRVRAGSFVESWTQYDVELEHRRILPKEQRRELPGN